ncbi:phage tail terminator-like protein [Brevundimonas sp. FT23028]|uniref:phage tail terminator-like protein n=1 Tax=Brevundimonas sp. FT23028 TaxID=3393748 RepID=UPI003B5860CD
MPDPAEVAKLLLARCAILSVGSPVLPVAMPDVPFPPPSDGKYLRVSLFNNAPAWEGMNSGRMDQGLLQVTVVWPKGKGVIKAREVAADVMAHFPKGLKLVNAGAKVRINREPWAGSPILDDNASLVAITIPWVAV